MSIIAYRYDGFAKFWCHWIRKEATRYFHEFLVLILKRRPKDHQSDASNAIQIDVIHPYAAPMTGANDVNVLLIRMHLKTSKVSDYDYDYPNLCRLTLLSIPFEKTCDHRSLRK